MEAVLDVLLAVVLITTALAARALWRSAGEECPERDPDGPPMDRTDCMDLNRWAKTNKWEAM